MDNKIIKQIIEDAAKLAEQSVSAFEAQDKLASIEPLYKEAAEKIETLEKTAREEKEAFRTHVNKVANTLVTRGILEDSNKVAFVNTITEKPTEIFSVLEKIAGELKADSFGSADDSTKVASEELDSFEKLALGII